VLGLARFDPVTARAVCCDTAGEDDLGMAWQHWSREWAHQTAAALLVVAEDNPERLRSEAAFAHLCGVAPIPASSGKTTRHRLSRGGSRQANSALYLIAVGRMAWHPPTCAYVKRRTTCPWPCESPRLWPPESPHPR
jgi:hypothetical protein